MLDDVASAARSTPAEGVVRLVTRGYHWPGDGGGASYLHVGEQPQHKGRIRTADGRWWAFEGIEASVRQFGAKGDGGPGDARAIQDLFECRQVATIRFPAGRYRANDLQVRRPCTLVGEGAEIFWDEPCDRGSSMLAVYSDGVTVSGLKFRGIRYETWETPVGPHTLLRIDARTEEKDGAIRLTDLSFEGGQQGCVVAIATDIFIDRVLFVRQRVYGLVFLKGPRNAIVKGLVARQIGRYGGLKFSYQDAERPTERIVITDFVIEDSCRLHPDESEWQEGMDLVCGAVRDLVIANGVIAGCANGGIELKTGGKMIDPVDEYNDIQVSNVTIRMTDPRHGIVFNWTGPKTNSAKRGRRVVVSDCIIRHDVRGSESAGVEISAWSDIVFQNCFISGATVGFRISPYGGTSDIAEEIRLIGNRIEDVETGFLAVRGELNGLELSNNTIRAERFGIQLGGARVQDVTIAGNRIEQTGSPRGTGAAVLLSNCRATTVWNNLLQAKEGHGLRIRHITGARAEGEVVRNVVRAARNGFRVEDGRFTITDNHVEGGEGQHGLLIEGRADVRAAWNVRGVSATPGRLLGDPGDVVLARGDRAGTTAGWRHDPETIGGWQPIEAQPAMPRKRSLVERVAPGQAQRWDEAWRYLRRRWAERRGGR